MKNIPLLLNHCSELFSQWIYKTTRLRAADQIKNAYFRKRHYLGSKDRRLIEFLYYDMIRNMSLYMWQIQRGTGRKKDNIPPELLTVHAYKRHYPDESREIRFRITDRISHYFTEYFYTDIYPEHPAIRWSVPGMLWKRIKDAYSTVQLNECLRKLNCRAEVHIRTNTLKISRTELLSRMQDIPLRKGNVSPDALRLEKHYEMTRHVLFKRGMFEFQDESSQLVAYACDPGREDLVIDLCAGGGGKSLHFSALMENQGSLIATDLYPERLHELSQRAKRAGVMNIHLTPVREISTSYKGKADILLIDAPCSGSGVYRRKPDTKWELTENKLQYYLRTQQQLLDSGADLVRSGGYLVYATCSIIPDENEKQINDFLSRHKDFEPASVYGAFSHYNIKFPESAEKHILRILPQDADSDGFFIAKLRRIKARQ